MNSLLMHRLRLLEHVEAVMAQRFVHEQLVFAEHVVLIFGALGAAGACFI